MGDEESFVGGQGDGGVDHQGQVREGGREEAGVPHFAYPLLKLISPDQNRKISILFLFKYSNWLQSPSNMRDE